MSLLRTARRVAVASAVHGRVQQRQAQRFAAAAPAPAAAAPAPVAPAAPTVPEPVAPPAPAGTGTPPPADPAQRLALIVQLGELRDAGLLTPEEFEAQKARLLA